MAKIQKPQRSHIEINRLIRQLNRMDLRHVDFEILKSQVKKLLANYRFVLGLTNGTEMFFRARIFNDGKLENTCDLHAPPEPLVTGFQRCNAPHKPMFYSSSKRIAALLEVDVQPGDKVYLSQWICGERIPVIKTLGEDVEQAIVEQIPPLDVLVNSYFHTIFTRPVHDSFSSSYKLTAAIVETHTTGFPENSENNIDDSGLVNFVYPSVADIVGSYNTAIYPNIAREKLELVHLMEVRIVSRDERAIEVEITDNAYEFPDGKIEWSGNKSKTPQLFKDRSQIALVETRCGWTVPMRDNEMSPEEVVNLLLD